MRFIGKNVKKAVKTGMKYQSIVTIPGILQKSDD